MQMMTGDDSKTEEDMKDLERILGMIGRASERKMVDQSVVLNGPSGMQEKLERAKQRQLQQVTGLFLGIVIRSSS
jgi:ubiquitin-protein ligase E3 D